ncbi:probable 2-oxoglutarate-dependent dioxygenase AOP1 [Tanacetum coccineum]
MGSLPKAKQQLPVIGLCLNNLDSSSSCDEVTRALEEYGCFIAVYDGISQELYDATVVASQQVFDLPVEKKVLNTRDAAGHGYLGQLPTMPLFERLSIEDATTPQGAQTFTKLMWPSGNPTFCESALAFAKVLAELEVIVMRMVAKSLGIEQDYEKLLESTTYIFKFNKYLSPPGGEKTVGIVPHTDKGFMTIIQQQKDGKGLEIKTKDGEWIEVEFEPSSFIVMAGDVCTAWSNGRIEAPSHRVMMEGHKDRISLVTSSFIRPDLKVEVPQGLVNENHPLKFKPFDHYKYIEYHNSTTDANGNRLEDAIRFYCGI